MRKSIIAVILAFFVVGIYAPQLYAQDQNSVSALKQQIIDVQNQGQLGFRNFTLCSTIVNYGEYTPYPSARVKSGSTIYFYYEPENIYTERVDGMYHISFTQDMIVKTASGETMLESPDALKFDYRSRSPVLDVYAVNSLKLGQLPAGEYVFIAVVHDKLRNADARHEFTFEVVDQSPTSDTQQ